MWARFGRAPVYLDPVRLAWFPAGRLTVGARRAGRRRARTSPGSASGAVKVLVRGCGWPRRPIRRSDGIGVSRRRLKHHDDAQLHVRLSREHLAPHELHLALRLGVDLLQGRPFRHPRASCSVLAAVRLQVEREVHAIAVDALHPEGAVRDDVEARQRHPRLGDPLRPDADRLRRAAARVAKTSASAALLASRSSSERSVLGRAASCSSLSSPSVAELDANLRALERRDRLVGSGRQLADCSLAGVAFLTSATSQSAPPSSFLAGPSARPKSTVGIATRGPSASRARSRPARRSRCASRPARRRRATIRGSSPSPIISTVVGASLRVPLVGDPRREDAVAAAARSPMTPTPPRPPEAPWSSFGSAVAYLSVPAPASRADARVRALLLVAGSREGHDASARADTDEREREREGTRHRAVHGPLLYHSVCPEVPTRCSQARRVAAHGNGRVGSSFLYFFL